MSALVLLDSPLSPINSLAEGAAPPNRRRRRLLLLSALLLLTTAWWFWPVADPRFVGQWAAFPNETSTQQTGTFDFRANGSGWFSWSGATYFTCWDTSDPNSLHFGLRLAESRFVAAIRNVTGPMTWMTTMHYEIHTINETEIQLQNGPAFQPTLTLRRIAR